MQRFYEKVKDAKDIQVRTICKDYESGDSVHAQDYMQQHGFTFPVITDWATIARLFFERHSNQALVNPQGQLAYPVHAGPLRHFLSEVERASPRN